MKGVVLAGGTGSRLHPLTRVTNKHLLPVYNQPMVFYPIQALVNIGISSCKPPLWSVPTAFLSGSAAATGIATINSIGNLGGFAGPAVIGWIKEVTGSFAGGLYFVGGLLLMSALLIWLLSRSHHPKAEPATQS